MDRGSAGDLTSAEAQARRDLLRERARERRRGRRVQEPVPAERDAGPLAGTPSGLRRETERFRTPEWLDRSFVLPLARPHMSILPSQSVPHHDEHGTSSPGERVRPAPRLAPVASAAPEDPARASRPAAPVFVRPPSLEIDFARVVRRADLRRTATRMALTATGLSGILLMVYLLTGATGALVAALMAAVVALAAVGVRLRLATAPVPYLQRPRPTH